MTHDLLAATVRLAGTLEAENVALRALNLPAAAALLPEKQAATDAFEAARKAAPPVRSETLRGAASNLVAQADENRRLLERAILVQTRVLGIIAGAARASNPAPRYGRSGAYAARAPTGWALSARA